MHPSIPLHPPRRAAPAATTRLAAGALALALLAAACGEGSPLRRAVAPPTAHERYAQGLRDARLDGTALGRAWLGAAERSVRGAAAVPLPFREAGFFAPSEARAVAYRVSVRRGQRVVASVVPSGAPAVGAAAPLVFVDVFPLPLDSASLGAPLTSADSGTARVAFEAARDGEYVVRVQPELLREVGYEVRIESEASLAFPVDGRDSRAVRSFWGADRDGGVRSHQGIDIFAPRGTPVVAAAAGMAWAGDNRLGGRVVFVRDPIRGVSQYYAHLDSQAVRSGQLVRVGDTLGFVGNTGNARTTAPHLHFGIYARGEGAVDPLPFVDTRRAVLPALGRDTAWLGRLARTRTASVAVRAAPGERAVELRELARHTALTVDGAAARGWLRVRLPDAVEGWVRADAVERADTPLRVERLAGDVTVRARPALDAPTVRTVAAPVAAPVLGRYEGFVLVRLEGSAPGWIADE